MAGFHRLSLAFLLLVVVVAGDLMISTATSMAVGTSDDDGPPIKISMRYANAEESRWLDSWAEKTQSAGGGGGDDFEVRRATDEESARLNRMRADADRRARDGSGFGFDGHIEFDDDHPFGRVVVTDFPPSSKPNDDL
ncbi:uncharacterized protein [Oryza sativa Japonica Group]|uniref:Os05g0517400 protein n=3 Tax=Oryza sativa subsp. japonica TaxID=39947 RepID=Q75II6_ORYSJ|nr:uncharacterized protein LOC4339328 [Oryza sativa Japonica Group]KAB8100196.1 hypothetical protein EE612_030641 [Oryza sativa]AAT01319.1 unknown protein [Oryza sativa Japonica Group]KAF2931653.1 hypothetical protein DAI22_05g227700 [Oryza sativa Japonica Group]BAF17965.1 Os05g0517400 [Oryza sativa Japonica Group]BAG97831.1 unnamed protein product [Oryza sativa Japonica Group]|eukprot:NP_001056051.1 Os05g0517400 [Oryza sativa Japonica Group]